MAELPARIEDNQKFVGEKLVWINGMPVAHKAKPFTTPAIAQMIPAAAQVEYVPKRDSDHNLLPGEERFVGKSKLEVATERYLDEAAYGDPKRLEHIWDRTLGKPKQSVESLSVSMNYQDFLKSCSPPTEEELRDIGESIDVEYEDYSDLDGV